MWVSDVQGDQIYQFLIDMFIYTNILIDNVLQEGCKCISWVIEQTHCNKFAFSL